MAKGRLKFMNQEKGYGFITPDGGGKDLFVHKNDCISDLQDGDDVQFETKEGKKGLQAVKVSILN